MSVPSQANPATASTPLADLLNTTIDRAEAIAAAARNGTPYGIPSGLPTLDRHTHGFQPGRLTVIASRPSAGRTTLLATICRAAAIAEHTPTAVFTMEETAQEFGARILSGHAKVNFGHLHHGSLDDTDRQQIAKALPDIRSAPLRVHADPWLTLDQLAAKAAAAVADHGVRLIAVDGIQDVKPEKPNDLREREVGDVARGLKTLARELDVSVVATSHLNRSAEQRPGKRPAIDDLRESGAVTFAADQIILIHRPDLYEPESERAGETDLIVAKDRFGVPATVTVAHEFRYARHVDMGA